jgi:hypothetical protein
MNTYQLLIGANNTTKELETSKIISIASQHFDGFNLSETLGFWQGVQERTANLTIATDKPLLIERLANILKSELNQDAVAVLTIGNMEFI